MPDEIWIDETETIEDLGRAGFRLIQNKTGFRYGEDTVLLAWFADLRVSARKKQVKAIELGSNCGAATMLLAARRKNIFLDAVEILPSAEKIFRRNILLNGLTGRVRSYCLDIRDLISHPHPDICKASYDLVFFNPPYRSLHRGPITQTAIKSPDLLAARFEISGTTCDFITAAEMLLVPQGILVMVHRVSRLPEVLALMNRAHIEPTSLRFIHPKIGKQATLFMLSGTKAGKPGGFQVIEPLILYDEDNKYTKECMAIYHEENAGII